MTPAWTPPQLADPPWVDHALFLLQGKRPEELTPWEYEFLPSISLQRGRGKLLTPAQVSALLRIHNRYFPATDIPSYKPYLPDDWVPFPTETP